MNSLRTMTTSWIVTVLSLNLFMVQSGCGTWIKNPDAGPTPTGGGKVRVKVETTENSGGGTGGPTQGGTPTYTTVDKNGASAGSVSFTEAAMVLESLTFKSLAGRAGDVAFNGPYMMNLMNSAITPDMQGTLPAGEYHVVEGKLKKVGGPDVGKLGVNAQMAGFSTLVSGTYDDGKGNTKTILVRFDADGTFSLNGASSKPIVMTEGGELDLAINLNVNSWFNFSGSSVDFTSIEGSTIQLDKDSVGVEAQLYEIVKKNFTNAIQLVEKGKAPAPPKPK